MKIPDGAISAAQVWDYSTKPSYGGWTRVSDAQVRRLLEGAAMFLIDTQFDRAEVEKLRDELAAKATT